MQAASQSRTYGSINPTTDTVTLTSGTLANSDALSTTSVSSTATNTTAAGQTAALTPSSQTFSAGTAGNYAITYADGTLTVNQRPITVQAASQSRTYGSANPATDTVTLTSGTLANSDTLSTASVSSTASNTTAAGQTAALTPSSQTFSVGTASNYAITYDDGSLTVTPLIVNVATVGGATRVYNGTNNAAANLLTVTNLINGDSITLSGSGTLAGSSVGYEALTGLGSLTVNNPNYTLTGGSTSGTVVITPQASVMANATLQVQTTNTAPAQTATPAATLTQTSPASSSGGQASSTFVNVVAPLPQISATFGGNTQLAIISAPTASEPTQAVSFSQARSMLQPVTTVDSQGVVSNVPQGPDVVRDVRVPVSRNSLVEIVNGGVKLPIGVEQELFVVKAQ